jgi:hypothetical protein
MKLRGKSQSQYLLSSQYINEGFAGWKERYKKVSGYNKKEYEDMVEEVYLYYMEGKAPKKEYRKGAPIYGNNEENEYKLNEKHNPKDLYKRNDIWYKMRELEKMKTPKS